ncbi:MAG: DUF1987 domain-containing protein [Cyclobacteriaceae bacterium]
MDGYFIRPTRVTPSVYFNPAKGIMDMRGRSCPENPVKFYSYLLNSLKEFEHSDFQYLKTNIAFEYFNTSSSKCVFLILRKLDDLIRRGKSVRVNWFYEAGDMDMYESGEDLCSFFSLRINFIEVPEIQILGKLQEQIKPQLVA